MTKLLIFILLNYFILGNALRCGNGLKKHKEPNLIEVNQNIRVLEEDIFFKPIRIKVDYTQLKIDTKNYQEIFDIIKSSLDSAVHYFESLLSVQRYSLQNQSHTYFENSCEVDNVDINIPSWIGNYDIVLFPSFTYDDPTPYVYASAFPCLSLSINKRPTAGKIEIQNNFNFKRNNIKQFLRTVLFHELSHIFVFDPYLFNYIGAIKYINKDDESIPVITSEKALAKARLHFNCQTLEGIPLENEGGSGSEISHWEARYMLGDYMVSSNYLENVISDITLALFEDSGWYEVNYYTGGLFRFGKNEGCQFFEKKCIIDGDVVFPNEFCNSKKEPKCLNSHLGTGECYIGKYEEGEIPTKYQYFSDEKKGGLYNAEYCPVADLYATDSKNNSYFENSCNFGDSLNLFNHYGEVIGNNSICFESSLVPRYSPQPYKWRTICYPISCDRKNKQIIVYINDLSVVCPSEGGTLKKIKGFKGKINCPKYNMICTSDIWCNEMFDCIDKKSVTDENTFDAINIENDL